MTNLRTTYASFTSGQVSSIKSYQNVAPVAKAIEGRSTLEVFQTGLRQCENFFPMVAGPLLARSGFQKIANGDTYVKIAPFSFNQSQLYLFCFSEGSLDIFRNDVLVAGSITVPWTAAQLPFLRWAQQGDTFIGVHQSVAPTSIKRNSSDTSWTVSTISFTNAPTYDFGSGSEAAWSGTRGYPSTACFHQGRLILAGTTQLPETIWGSLTGSPFNFATATGSGGTTLASDSFTFTLSDAAGIHTIQDVFSVNQTLFIHSSLGEWIEGDNPLDATQVGFNLTSRHGMSATGIRSQGIDSASLFVDRQSNLRSMSYDFVQNVYVAKNLSTLTPGLLNAPTQLAYLRGWQTSNLLVARNADGTLNLLTVDFDQQVKGWSTMSAGQSEDGTPLVASFLSIAVLDFDSPALYALIQYNAHTYLTKLTLDAQLDIWTKATSGSPQQTWTGFVDFANQTVRVIGDGAQFASVAVDGSGNFTVPTKVSTVIVGLPYLCLAETLPLAPVIQGQNVRGNRIRKVFADLVLRNTTGLYVDGRPLITRQLGTSLLDQPGTPIDTTKRVRLSGIGPEPTVIIEARDSLPAMILNLILTVSTQIPQL